MRNRIKRSDDKRMQVLYDLRQISFSCLLGHDGLDHWVGFLVLINVFWNRIDDLSLVWVQSLNFLAKIELSEQGTKHVHRLVSNSEQVVHGPHVSFVKSDVFLFSCKTIKVPMYCGDLFIHIMTNEPFRVCVKEGLSQSFINIDSCSTWSKILKQLLCRLNILIKMSWCEMKPNCCC